MRLRRRQPAGGFPEKRQHLVPNDADDLLRRRQAFQNFLVDRAIADAVDERLDDLEVDVRLEQRHPDLSKCRLDGRFGQSGFAAERAKYSLQSVAERFKHVVNDRR